VAAVRRRATWKAHAKAATAVTFSPVGRAVASGGWDPDPAVRIWDAATGRLTATIKGHTLGVRSLAYAPDGKTLFSHGDGPVRVWDAATGEEVASLGERAGCQCMAVSPDGRHVATVSSVGVQVWDVKTGDEVASLKDRVRVVAQATFSPDGRSVAWGSSDRAAWVWAWADRRPPVAFAGHTGWVNQVEFTPDGKTLVTGGMDATVRFWDPATGKALGELKGEPKRFQRFAVHPDGKTLAVADGTAVKLWDINPYPAGEVRR
jgi:WD40 repeat protein